MLSFTRRTERKLRDRNSQLVVPNKSFARVRTICEQQLNLMRQPQHKPNQPSKPAPTPARVSHHKGPHTCTCLVLSKLHVTNMQLLANWLLTNLQMANLQESSCGKHVFCVSQCRQTLS